MTVATIPASVKTMSDSRLKKLLLGQGAPPQVAALLYATTDLWYLEKDLPDPRPLAFLPTVARAPKGKDAISATRISRSEFLMMRGHALDQAGGAPRLPMVRDVQQPVKLPSLVAQAPVPAGLLSSTPSYGLGPSRTGPVASVSPPVSDVPYVPAKLTGKDFDILDGSCDDMTDVDSEIESAWDNEEDVQVLVGPSQLASAPWVINDLWLEAPPETPGGPPQRVMIRSMPNRLLLSETRLLSLARPDGLPISFGSVVHLRFGKRQPCRSCMFEKSNTRSCRRSWLCDFCHLHTRGSGNNAYLDQQQQLPQQQVHRSRTHMKQDRNQVQNMSKRGPVPHGMTGLTRFADAWGQASPTSTISTMDILPTVGGRSSTFGTFESLPYVGTLSTNSLPMM